MDKSKESQNKFTKPSEGKELWEYATKDVNPLNETNKRLSQKRITIETSANLPAQNAPTYTKSNKASIPKSNETDKRTAQKLKRGQIQIDARLDLHGMSKSKAYATLKSFIPSSRQKGHKCILIITGKGKPRHGNIPLINQVPGILKTSTPLWLQEPEFQQHVLKFETAKPKHGGEGALYVLLRKK